MQDGQNRRKSMEIDRNVTKPGRASEREARQAIDLCNNGHVSRPAKGEKTCIDSKCSLLLCREMPCQKMRVPCQKMPGRSSSPVAPRPDFSDSMALSAKTVRQCSVRAWLVKKCLVDKNACQNVPCQKDAL